MARQQTIDIAAKHLFDDIAELQARFDDLMVRRIIRVRELYCWFIDHPVTPDREFVERDCKVHGVGKSQAYEDLAILKALIPQAHKTSREFYRYRTNEMLLETYALAKAKNKLDVMERVASSIAKINRVDLEEEKEMPFELIVVQPFTPTVDPSVLGIKPIPNLREKIKQLEDKYGANTMDFEDVEYEEADLLEDELFGPEKKEENNG